MKKPKQHEKLTLTTVRGGVKLKTNVKAGLKTEWITSLKTEWITSIR